MSALIKPFETNITLKPPVIIMDAANMAIQFALVFKRYTALTTFKWFLSAVSPEMPLPISAMIEYLGTNITFKSLLFLVGTARMFVQGILYLE